jgi:hypothetical protein
MTRDEVLALYRPIRVAIRRITSLAIKTCSRQDLKRAAKQLDLWSPQGIVGIEDDETLEMISDVALFEPNQRGRIAFDAFVEQQAKKIAPPDLALAERMKRSRFSLFRCAGRHELAGVWLEDLLDDNRRLWLMDEGLERTVKSGMVLGMRLFDAGPFHAGYGIIVQPDEETTEWSVVGQQRNGREPFRHSLAVTLYDDKLRASRPLSPELQRALDTMVDLLEPGSFEQSGKGKTVATGKRRTR